MFVRKKILFIGVYCLIGPIVPMIFMIIAAVFKQHTPSIGSVFLVGIFSFVFGFFPALIAGATHLTILTNIERIPVLKKSVGLLGQLAQGAIFGCLSGTICTLFFYGIFYAFGRPVFSWPIGFSGALAGLITGCVATSIVMKKGRSLNN